MHKEKNHVWESEVKNYELDFQGIVGHARYLDYLNHARVEYMTSLGFDFYALSEIDADLVLAHVDISYRAPLMGGDRFSIVTHLSLSGKIRMLWKQTIFKLPEQKIVVEAETTTVLISRKTRKPIFPEVLQNLFV